MRIYAKLLSIALVGLALGACSNEDVALDNPSKPGTTANGGNYLSVAVNLPTTPGTRANDNFDAGTADEYEVKDATLILFNGAAEGSANFLGAYTLNTNPWTDPNQAGNITTTSVNFVQKIKGYTGNLYALAVLNNNGTLVVTAPDAEGNTTLTVNGTAFTGTFSAFQALASTTGNNLHANGFYMTNAPVYSGTTATGGGAAAPAGGNVTTLTQVLKTYGTYEEAAADKANAAKIYVERAVAKVNVSGTTTGTLTQVTGVSYEITGWAVDNYNPTSYYVRNVEGFDGWLNLKSNSTSVTNPYRFVGSAAIANGIFRTYFAKDMNYNTTGVGTLVTGGLTDATGALGTPQYCFENTFDVDNQNENQTTRVIVKAELNGGQTFYLVNHNTGVLYSEADIKNLVLGTFLRDATVVNWLKANGKPGMEFGAADFNVTYSGTAAGEVTVAGIEFTTEGADKIKDEISLTGLPQAGAAIEALGAIERYLNGVSYYAVYIKHFGDDLTPWKNHETPQPGLGSSYPAGDSREGNYLGRYGVLRNNWYEVNVTSIKNIGSPTVPTVTTEPDDKIEQYITAEINVLSWAKRVQNADL